MNTVRSGNGPQPERAPGRDIIEDALSRGDTNLDEIEAKQLFQAYGIPVVDGGVAADSEQAVGMAQDVGFPVVMKGASRRIMHKSEAGLVMVDLHDEEAVRGCFKELMRRGDGQLDGVLVERMVPAMREFVVGMNRDRQFGPVVMFGLGGVLTEALDDVAFGVAPLSEREADELLDEVRAKELLGDFRGTPPVDREALVEIILSVAQIALDHPEVAEIDVNPVLVDGDRPVAVDALVALGPPASPPPARLHADLDTLDAVFSPRSVAIVGASNEATKWGGVILTNMMGGGYPGPIYPVNVRTDQVFGRKSYRSVADLPEVPDLVMIAVPARLVPEVVEECGRVGARAVVVISSGFSEVGEEGARLEREVAEIASRYRMAMVGPNCMGVMSSWSRFYATGAAIMRPLPGPASFISQSGNMGIQLMASAEQRQGGIGKFVGVGNEALFDATDLIDYFRRDPQTGLILGYIEGFDDGRRFMEAAREAVAEKPVIVLRAGTSEFGKRAAASHTGALAGSAKVFEAVVRQSGVISTYDPDEFLDLAFSLSYLPVPRGKRVAVVTMGGGWGVISADEIARSGLQLASLGDDVIDELSEILPPFWSHANPVDLVGTSEEGVAERAVEIVARCPDVDALIVLGVIGMMTAPIRVFAELDRLATEMSFELPEGADGGRDRFCEREGQFIRRMSDLMERYEKPIIAVSFTPLDRAVFEFGGRYAAVVLPSPLRSVRVIAKMAKHGAFLDRVGLREAR
jgi:acyl-CoA synthetase (NDP forming)